MNQVAEGKRYPDETFTVEPERVAAFRRIFGLREGVPPTFVTVAEFAMFPRIVADPELGVDLARIVHGSQEYEFERPLVEGETLTIRSRIGSIRERAGTAFFTIVTELVGADGRVAVTARSSMIERAAT